MSNRVPRQTATRTEKNVMLDVTPLPSDRSRGAKAVSEAKVLFMTPHIIKLDGIVNDHHTCDAVALEDAEVCVMPFDQIEELSRDVSALQHHIHKIMSREIVRE